MCCVSERAVRTQQSAPACVCHTSTDCDQARRLTVPPAQEPSRATALQTADCAADCAADCRLRCGLRCRLHGIRVAASSALHTRLAGVSLCVGCDQLSLWCFCLKSLSMTVLCSAGSDKLSFCTPARARLLYGADLHDRVPPRNTAGFASSPRGRYCCAAAQPPATSSSSHTFLSMQL